MANIPPPLSGIPTLNAPSLTAPTLSPIPPALSPIPPALSPNPPSLSATPPPLSATPPALSPEPPALSPEPPALSPEPPALSPEPPALSQEPPSLTPNIPPPSIPQPEPTALSPEPPALSPEPPQFANSSSTSSFQNSLSNVAVNNASESSFTESTSVNLVPSKAPLVIQPNDLPSKLPVNDRGIPPLPIKPFPSIVSYPSTKVITVSPTEEGVIAAAAESAEPGSTIVVQAGRYVECIRVDKPLRFVCDGKVSLRSDGLGEIFIINSPYVYIDGFHIKQDVSRARGSITVNGGAVHFNNCKLSSLAFAIIQLRRDTQLKCTGCKFFANKCPAILSAYNGEIDVDQCIFNNSKTVLATLKGSTIAHFTQCLLKNGLKGGIICVEQAQVEVSYCTFMDSTVELNSTSEINCIKGCTFESTNPELKSGIITALTSTSYIIVNNFNKSTVDCRDQSKVRFRDNRYNSSSLIAWGNASLEAETETYTGDILNAAGASITLSVTSTLHIKKSTFNNINGYAIFACDTSKITLSLCRFTTITKSAIVAYNGSCLIAADCDIQSTQDVAISLNQAHNATFTRVMVRDTSNSGLETLNTNSLTLDGCKFENCRKCGLFLSNSAGAFAKNVTLDHNGYSGAHLSKTDITFEGCTITQNKKGGIFSCQRSTIQVNECTFSRNDWAGLYVETDSKATVEKCTFQENVLSANIAGNAVMSETKIVRQLQSNQTTPSLQVSGGILECNNCQLESNAIGCLVCDHGKLTSNQTEFKSNKVHLEITRQGEGNLSKCKFLNSTGEYSVRISEDANATIDNCEISGSGGVGVCVEAGITLTNSTIKDSRIIGALCSGTSTKMIKNNQFTNNGECAVQCNCGNLSVIGNNLSDHKKFGIYITAGASPAVEENSFHNNHLANIWHD